MSLAIRNHLYRSNIINVFDWVIFREYLINLLLGSYCKTLYYDYIILIIINIEMGKVKIENSDCVAMLVL